MEKLKQSWHNRNDFVANLTTQVYDAIIEDQSDG